MMDTIGPLTRSRSGNIAIYMITDRATRYAWAFAGRRINHIYAERFLKKVIKTNFGRPKIVVTDGGPEYRNHHFDVFLSSMKVKHEVTTPYHPQSNGQTERMNGTVVSIMKKYVSSRVKEWDEFLDDAVYSINCSKNEHTKIPPFILRNGMLPPSPIILGEEDVTDSYNWESLRVMQEVRESAQDSLYRAQQEYKRKYDEKREPFRLKEGDYVMVKNHHFEEGISRKLQERYSGPYRVKKIIENHSVEIEREGRARNIISKYGLKKCTSRDAALRDSDAQRNVSSLSESHEIEMQDPEHDCLHEDHVAVDQEEDLPHEQEGQESGTAQQEVDAEQFLDGVNDLFEELPVLRRSSRRRRAPVRLIQEA